MKTWPKRFDAATAHAYARQPQKIANRAYGGRMGNGPEASGDGWRFRGYGPIQLTGRGNREAFAKSLGLSLEDSEAYLLTPHGGIRAACWYWKTNELNRYADAEDVTGCTKVINGGFNGLEDRKAHYAECRALLGST
jgi:putative chitinase